MRRICAVFVLAGVLASGSAGKTPGVSFGGYLDSDVWTDFAGSFFSNDELDLAMGIGFGGKVSVGVCLTVASGSVPAGTGLPGGATVGKYVIGSDTLVITDSHTRWVSVAFDGITLSFDSKVGAFSVGDLVYQYGGFSYYLYKRLSMITPESFTRGVQYTTGSDAITQSLLIGSADADGTGDAGGATELSLDESHSVGLYYGIRGSVVESFETASTIYAGIEYAVSLGEAVELKLDVGYRNLPGAERSNAVAVLAEPSLALGRFSLAASYYQYFDPDETGTSFVDEDMYGYLEPGMSIADPFAVGLPLEIHAMGPVDGLADDGQFWAVPTAYIYPAAGVEWWVWGQLAVPLAGGDLAYGLGSEIIAKF